MAILGQGIRIGRGQNDRKAGMTDSHLFEKIYTIELRHPIIRDDDIELALAQLVECRDAIARRDDVVPLPRQDRTHEKSGMMVIIHHEHPFAIPFHPGLLR
jgi:hypothetical protein